MNKVELFLSKFGCIWTGDLDPCPRQVFFDENETRFIYYRNTKMWRDCLMEEDFTDDEFPHHIERLEELQAFW